ncbi:MAG: BrnA antitoxin family protein [Burkholderiaceae bacterium]
MFYLFPATFHTNRADHQPAQAVKPVLKHGRPPAAATKDRITIRLSPEILDRFRATGPGWQTRVDAALKDWLESHEPA